MIHIRYSVRGFAATAIAAGLIGGHAMAQAPQTDARNSSVAAPSPPSAICARIGKGADDIKNHLSSYIDAQNDYVAEKNRQAAFIMEWYPDGDPSLNQGMHQAQLAEQRDVYAEVRRLSAKVEDTRQNIKRIDETRPRCEVAAPESTAVRECARALNVIDVIGDRYEPELRKARAAIVNGEGEQKKILSRPDALERAAVLAKDSLRRVDVFTTNRNNWNSAQKTIDDAFLALDAKTADLWETFAAMRSTCSMVGP